MTTDDQLPTRTVERLAEISQPSKYPAPTGPWYHPTLHPDGAVNLSTAENTLLTSEIVPILRDAQVQEQHLKYRTTLVRSGVEQLADLLPRYVSRSNPVRPVTRQNSVAGPGVGALLAQLVWALCAEGEGVLMATPYYHDYVRDIVYPARAVPVFAHIPASVDPLSPAVIPFLRERIRSSANDGIPIRALLLCNPHNPIPQCYPIETLQGHLDLAQEVQSSPTNPTLALADGLAQFGIHLISDELFAQSVFPTRRHPDPRPFISVLSLPAWSADSPMLRQIHVLGSMTKDLGLSGLKAALLVTENESVRKCVEVGLWATPISGLSDAAMSHLLSDEERVDGLLTKNVRLLGRAMELCADWSDYHGFPYIEANAGCYFVIDFARLMPGLGLPEHATGLDGEIELMRRMIKNGVHINPMSLDDDPTPYRFRFIFAKDDSVLRLALRRLETAFGLEPFPFPENP